jgi:hypothetical protein
MSKVKLKIQLTGTENSKTNIVTDGININQQTEESQVTEINRNFIKTIADAASDIELLDTVLADSLVLISTDVEVSIKINGSTDSQTLKPITGVKTPVFLYRGSISSILVSNSSGSDATLDVTRIKV